MRKMKNSHKLAVLLLIASQGAAPPAEAGRYTKPGADRLRAMNGVPVLPPVPGEQPAPLRRRTNSGPSENEYSNVGLPAIRRRSGSDNGLTSGDYQAPAARPRAGSDPGPETAIYSNVGLPVTAGRWVSGRL